MFNSIMEALAQHAVKQPDKLCIVDEKREYTYGEIFRLAAQCREALKEYGVGAGDYVVVECTQDAGFLVCSPACQQIRALFVPVENKAAQERTAEILRETKAKLFLYENPIEISAPMVDITTFFEKVEGISAEQLSMDYCFGEAMEPSTQVL